MRRSIDAFVAPSLPKLPTAVAAAALVGAYASGLLAPDAALEFIAERMGSQG